MAVGQKKRILLLGGSGLLGYHCIEAISPFARLFSTYNTTSIEVPNAVFFSALDSENDLLKIFNDIRPDAVINTIAMVDVDNCEEKSLEAYNLNAEFVNQLVQRLADCKLFSTHLIQISSDSVYGSCVKIPSIPWNENDKCNPISEYAKTKFLGEQFAIKHSGPVTVLRTAFYGITPYSTKGLLGWIIENAKNNQEISGWDNVFFSPVSACLLASSIYQIIEKAITGTLNIASDDACSKYDFLMEVCKKFSRLPKLNRIQADTGGKSIRSLYTVLSTQRIKELLPWGIQWKENLAKYLEYCFANY